jgi:hypothetical protein
VKIAVVLVSALLALPALAEEERLLRLTVERKDLSYTGPCKASLYAQNQADEAPVHEHDDLSEPVRVAAGHYHVLVSCPSTEGELRQTVPVDLRRKDVEQRLRLSPAFVVVRVVREGKEVPATIRVTDEHGRLVQEGQHKVALPVPPGRLTVLARVDEAAAGTRRPVLGTLTLSAVAGKKESPVIDTSDGVLVLGLMNNGRPAAGIGSLRLPASGERLLEIESDQDAPVSPGTYHLFTQLADGHDYAEVQRRNVSIKPGQTVKVKVAHTTGQLAPELRLFGRALAADEEGEVELFLGAAPVAFNTLAGGDVATLSPGRYRVLGRLKSRTLDDGAPFEAEGEARVTARGRAVLKLDLTPATLEVKTRVGGEDRPLSVEIFRQGGESPVAKKVADDKGEVRFALSPGTYRVVTTFTATQGPLVAEARAFLVRGKAERKAIDLAVGRALVQVFEAGVAVPAEVLFFQEGAGEPLLGIAAGREAYLPPGTYSLRVRRKGQERTFAPLTIAVGRVAERQVELNATAKPAGSTP